MINIKINDNLFGHSPSSSWYNKPKNIIWDRTPYSNKDIVVFTDNNLKNVTDKIKYKIAWLLESPVVTSTAYDWIINNYEKFDLILTFDKELLKINKKFIFNPIGGCWIESKNQRNYKKTKNISIISSEKNITTGHKLRHNVIKEFEYIIDVYGRGYNPIDYKLDGLKDYRFSIVIENTKKDYYFTEKLIDTFRTGTIPIYYGCPSINEFFDERGIITFDSIKELKDIIYNLNDNKYNEMLEYVKINFKEAKNYLISEDNIYKILKNNNIIK